MKYLAYLRGTTVDNAKAIYSDLKQSWYFRIWCVLWVICFLTSFIFLTFFSARSDILTKEGVWRMSARHESEIAYPAFRIRVSPSSPLNFTSVVCTHGAGVGVTTNACDTTNRCIAVAVEGLVAKVGDASINCHITCKSQLPSTIHAIDETLIWELGSDNHFRGPNFGVFIRPNDRAWVALQKVVATLMGDSSPRTFWERKLVYQVNTGERLTYQIDTVMDSFAVLEYFQGNRYNGWQAVGDIGGFAFFTIILHMLFMMLVGVFLRNESTFLKGSGHDGAMPPMMYDNGKSALHDDDLGERAPMLGKN